MNSMRPYFSGNFYARAKYIDVLIAESKNQKAAQEALELDALYSIQSAWGYYNLNVESCMGVALVCGGYYELGLKYLERVKEEREKELKNTLITTNSKQIPALLITIFPWDTAN